jgi:hypothetical protein
MKKIVHAPSIHGGVLVGVGSLWPQTPSQTSKLEP